jgi:hypothetical protein
MLLLLSDAIYYICCQNNNQLKIYKKIISASVVFPPNFHHEPSKDIILRLLHKHVPHRLGCLKSGARGVIQHRFFKGFDFEALLSKTLAPPIVPVIGDALDVSNFDLLDDNQDIVQGFIPTGNDYWILNF